LDRHIEGSKDSVTCCFCQTKAFLYWPLIEFTIKKWPSTVSNLWILIWWIKTWVFYFVMYL